MERHEKRNDYSQRRSKYYNDSPSYPTMRISQILPRLLEKISKDYQDRPDMILAAWPEVVGAQLAPMTKATAFSDGLLYVTVSNSTLYSLLNQHDKPRIIKNLRDKFPSTQIKTVLFRLG